VLALLVLQLAQAEQRAHQQASCLLLTSLPLEQEVVPAKLASHRHLLSK
jgi:hypothetical protein